MIQYFFYSVLGLGISLLVYRCLLKKEKLFVFNRYFLLVSLCLCLLAPLLQFNYGNLLKVTPKVTIEKFFQSEKIDIEVQDKIYVETISTPLIDYKVLLKILYWTITGLLVLRFGKNILSLSNQIKRGRSNSIAGLRIVSLKERGNPYSFFNYLFIHPCDLEDKKYMDLVLPHEKAHSQQYHSADILFMELLGCFFWYNPVLWFYKKEILENHEYLADEAVIKSGGNREVYASQLINAGSKVMQPLLSGFSFIQTKNRLYMLHTKRSSGSRIAFKTGIAVILFTAIFAVSSFSTKENSSPFIVVVDAGHGGKDPGSRAGGAFEKDINLAIANQLQALSSEKEVKIILIRDKDEFLTLQDRVNFVNSQGANLFLSLHCNSSGDPQKSGAEVIFSSESENKATSSDYSKLLAMSLIPAFGEAEIKSANFLVLKNSEIPAMMIEMGYMTNVRDFALLQDKRYQEELAQNIYKGLISIKEASYK